MNIEELKKHLEEKENLKIRTELIYQQILGQINILRDLIQHEEEKPVEKIEEKT
jgi:hypothetical protein